MKKKKINEKWNEEIGREKIEYRRQPSVRKKDGGLKECKS